MPHLAITFQSWLLVTALGIIWGGSFIATEIALHDLSPYWITAYRMSIAAGLVSLVWVRRGLPLYHASSGTMLPLFALGFLNAALPFQLITWGQQHVTAGFAGVSMASVGIFVLPMAHFLIKGEQLNAGRLFGFLIGLGGVAILIGDSALDTSGSDLEWLGRLSCIAGASCYAISSIITRQLPVIDPVGLLAVPLIVGALYCVGVALMLAGPPKLMSEDAFLAVVMLGLFPTALAGLLRDQVIRTAGPVFMSLANYQVPIWSVIFGILFLGEPFFLNLLLALTLVLLGTGLSQKDALRSLFQNAKQNPRT